MMTVSALPSLSTDASPGVIRGAAPAPRSAAARQAFDAMVVGFMVKETLPDMPGLSGPGADLWRGLLADAIGEQISRSGTLSLVPTERGNADGR